MDRTAKEEMKKMNFGEDAISFFAKYGNTTPIKFIYCERAINKDPSIFKPYDLVVIADQTMR